ncbi:MAG: glyoxalase [Chloroflexi bacterium]|nr:VOC family protein [Chloroflexota bacterium]MQC27376.1 glyoxalase [Chloroflexota bacterium]
MSEAMEKLIVAKGPMHPDMRPGHVHHSVADLERQLAFYQQVLGLQLHWRKGLSAGLGVGGADLLRLTQIENGVRAHGVTGMYHFAILLPNQVELARAIGRLFALQYPNSPTDHVMTKTTYLDDAEGNNIELYAESPEDGIFGMMDGRFVAERADGRPSTGRDALDLEALFARLPEEPKLDQRMPPETRLGHVHLYVADLDDSLRFYHDILGLDNMGVARDFGAGFVSAGGYHHHIGFNIWQGQGARPAAADALGLRYFTLTLPNEAELEKVLGRVRAAGLETEAHAEGTLIRDPSGIAVVFGAR